MPVRMIARARALAVTATALVSSDGGIFAFGDARFSGSRGDRPLNAPVQSLVPDPDGTGYWLVASDGGVFAFSDRPFDRSLGDHPPARPVVSVAAFVG